MGAEPGRRFLKQPAAKLEPVIVDSKVSDIEGKMTWRPSSTTATPFLTLKTLIGVKPDQYRLAGALRVYGIHKSTTEWPVRKMVL